MHLNEGEHSRPGCGSARPRAELERAATHQTVCTSCALDAGREGAARCARGGRAPHSNCIVPAQSWIAPLGLVPGWAGAPAGVAGFANNVLE